MKNKTKLNIQSNISQCLLQKMETSSLTGIFLNKAARAIGIVG